MARAVFKHYGQGQVCNFPMSLDEKIPEDAPVRLVRYDYNGLCHLWYCVQYWKIMELQGKSKENSQKTGKKSDYCSFCPYA